MPYKLGKNSTGQHCLFKPDGSMVKGSCHDKKDDTMAMMRALYANESKSAGDGLIYFGSAVKALGDGKVGGHLVTFSGDADPDLVREFFTKSTDYFLDEDGGSTVVIYDHGLDPTLKTRKLGRGTLKVDDVGVWIEAQLTLADEYEKAVYAMAEAGKLGWSSGSAPHLVKREKVGKSVEIKSWPIVEASLTPMPVEPRCSAITLKSYMAEKAIESDEGELSVKAIFEAVLAEKQFRTWELWDAFCQAAQRIASAASNTDLTGVTVDIDALTDEAITEYSARLSAVVKKQIKDFISSGYTADRFYLKSTALDTLINESGEPRTGFQLSNHSESVLTAVEELVTQATKAGEVVKALTERFKGKTELDIKAGRVVSGTNRDRIKRNHEGLVEAHDKLHAVADDLLDLYASTDPEKKSAEKSADPELVLSLAANFESLKAKRLRASIG